MKLPIVLAYTFLTFSLVHADDAPKAITVSTYGKVMGVDANFNTKVLKAMTQALVEQKVIEGKTYTWSKKVKTYKLIDTGTEGGQSFCLDFGVEGSAEEAIATLKTFKDLGKKVPENTLYEVKVVEKCP